MHCDIAYASVGDIIRVSPNWIGQMIDKRTKELADRIRSTSETGQPLATKLQTDERIIARVTDGIYRQPWSAFRELISNAYDADATDVRINTNFPEFNTITIRDNGLGMDPEQVAHMLLHIGGSSKRTIIGSEIGTASKGNPRLSLGGRPLIGKIGIGIFAVSQLTQHFQIISKRKGTTERTSVSVLLKTYSEDALEQDSGVNFESGEVSILQESVDDADDFGTMVVLLDIRPEIRRQLQSLPLWEALDSLEEGGDGRSPIRPPKYHIGRLGKQSTFKLDPNLPWEDGDTSDEKFLSLVAAAQDNPGPRNQPRDLDHFDHYLQMIWNLSLSAPLPYVKEHPFDLGPNSGIAYYEIENKVRGKATPIKLSAGTTVRDHFDFQAGRLDPLGRFAVSVDDVDLRRPILLENQLVEGTRTRVPGPMLFFGKDSTDFAGASSDRSGGSVSFECYLYWNSKIVPKENNGVIVRINGASGTLFDNKFLNYRVSEQNRLRQITAEIFITKGLDGALNIDRESFNASHPHFIFVQHWLHNSLKQLATLQKNIGSALLKKERKGQKERQLARLEAHAMAVWERERGQIDLPLQTDIFDTSELPTAVGGTAVEWDEDRRANLTVEETREITATAVVLEAYGLLSAVSFEQRAQLIDDLTMVFGSDKGRN